MSMSYKIVTPPSEEPVSLVEAKQHLRIDGAHEDELVTGLIQSAREYVENATQRQLVTATLRMKLDDFPCGEEGNWNGWSPRAGRIRIARPPVQSVSAVTYVDANGTSTTFSAADYAVDVNSPDEPGVIYPVYGSWWPVARDERNAVTIDFVAGYGAAAAVPRIFKQAMLLMIGHWHENREAVVTGTIATQIPLAADALITQGRWQVH